jgi:hypothetical protein
MKFWILGGHLSALFGAQATGLGATLTMIYIMFCTFCGAGVTYFRTGIAKQSGVITFDGHQFGSRPADGSALSVKENAVCHHAHVFAVQTFSSTGFASRSAIQAYVDAVLNILVSHFLWD